MRMWDVPPRMMCRKHLLGEHVEMHRFTGTFRKKVNLKGYLDRGLIDTNKVQHRHDELVAEMIRRGYNHKSPIDVDLCIGIKDNYRTYKFDIDVNIAELIRRCAECRGLYNEYTRIYST